MNNNICDTCQYYQSEVCPIYDHNLPFETCPNHWSKRKNNQTVFDCITVSPEVLAPNFVFLKAVFVTNINPKQQWISTITVEVYQTRAEAIAATVAKLKEVAE